MEQLGRSRASSADNVLTLLSLLASRGELRVAQAAEELRVGRSTAHRLLSTLRRHDFAVQDSRRIYRPGAALVGMQTAAHQVDVTVIVHRHLRDLVAVSQETAHFMRLEGNGVRFVDGVEGSQSLRCGTRIGLLMPAHMTSGGKAMLAELPPQQLHRLYPRGLPRADTPAITDLTELLRELASVRRRGYAINREESEPGIAAVGTCVRDHRGSVIGALTIAAPTVRCDQQRMSRLADALQAVTRALTAEL